ncbi:MAG: hypothetical protein IJ127_13425 [Afipia sp.]|jgi:hypothetical protein|nr:hypothetical protein [Afipia sp.]MBS4003048.1 hypothetical protein [Afipia sp.]WIG50085.1 MAG: hypothetical protein OJF48_001002 [Afipia sp.]
MHRSSLFAAIVMMLMCGVTSALADCREDHAAADQNVRRARAGIEKLTDSTDAAMCAAYRRYIAALTAQRGVIERCDAGPNRAQNVGAIDTAIADYNKRVEGVCKR